MSPVIRTASGAQVAPRAVTGLPRTDPAAPGARAVRAVVFAAVTLGLAVAAHRMAGGGRDSTLFALGFTGLLGLGWVLSRRERSGRVVAAAVIGSQLVLHLCFVLPGLLRVRQAGSTGGLSDAQLSALLFCHHGSTPITGAQLHQAAAGLDLTRYPSSAPGPSLLSLLGPAALMLALHLLAAAVVAGWLRRGERAAWRRWVTVLRCGRTVVVPAPAPSEVPARPDRPAAAAVARFWSSPRVVRGPPSLRAEPSSV